MILYCIHATVTKPPIDRFTSVVEVPTFFLRDDIQGITGCDHAERIVKDMLKDLVSPGAKIQVVVTSTSR